MIGDWARRLAVLLLVCVLAISTSPGASAQEDWRISRFFALIAIERDSSITVTETIDVDFGALERRGIIRVIPIRYAYDDDNDRVYDVRVRSVTRDDGSAWLWRTDEVGPNLEIRIGNPDVYITGKQTYEIRYTVAGAMNAFADHDELYWNVNGGNWDVPSDAVSAIVLAGGGIIGRECYEGPEGVTDRCNHTGDATRAGFVATRQLFAGEQLTAVVALEKGTVADPAPILVARPKEQDPFRRSPAVLAAAGAILAAGAGFAVTSWLRGGRDRVYRTLYHLTRDASEMPKPLVGGPDVVVEYTPPESLRPAQMMLLLDERVDGRAVTATIVDLAVRGYLRIEEQGDDEWRLYRLKEPSDLAAYERMIFNGLFGSKQDVLLSDVEAAYGAALQNAYSELYEDALRQRWFAAHPEKVRGRWSMLGIGMIAAGVAGAIFLGDRVGLALPGIALALSGGLVWLVSRAMPRRTAAGSEMMRRVLGFRLYITTAESRRAEFYEKAQIFAEYLPFAIVFGCVDRWAGVFSQIDTTQQTAAWYTGTSAARFNAAAMSSRIDSFSSGIASAGKAALIDTPGARGASGFYGSVGKSGGGFSGGGGGFSGGGGGGGGGRSW